MEIRSPPPPPPPAHTWNWACVCWNQARGIRVNAIAIVVPEDTHLRTVQERCCLTDTIGWVRQAAVRVSLTSNSFRRVPARLQQTENGPGENQAAINQKEEEPLIAHHLYWVSAALLRSYAATASSALFLMFFKIQGGSESCSWLRVCSATKSSATLRRGHLVEEGLRMEHDDAILLIFSVLKLIKIIAACGCVWLCQ